MSSIVATTTPIIPPSKVQLNGGMTSGVGGGATGAGGAGGGAGGAGGAGATTGGGAGAGSGGAGGGGARAIMAKVVKWLIETVMVLVAVSTSPSR